jgi:L-ascorbate metabolism protein UlaG (beta-lactamase superfamily)
MRLRTASVVLLLTACAAPPPPRSTPEAAQEPEPAAEPALPAPLAPVAREAPAQATPPAPAPPPLLEVTYLGVGGFLIRSGDDAVLTAPFFSNPGMTDVVIGEVAADPGEIDRFLPDADVADVRAILVGHGHYDHLMDVPHVWTKTPSATIYGNVASQSLLAAFAPDQPARCAEPLPAGAPVIPRENVVALNTPADNVVDYRGCPDTGGCFGPYGDAPGAWVHVPNSRVRLRALCNTHPAQFGPVHFGRGCIEEEACAPPARAPDWREGETLAFLIDFLDEDGAPIHRVYFQDAPAEVPVGAPDAELLGGKRIDAALLCVGTYDQVPDHPAATTLALDPRFAIGGHWEDFFRARDEPLRAIPFMDVEPFRVALEETLPPADDGAQRAFVPDPGSVFTFPAE